MQVRISIRVTEIKTVKYDVQKHLIRLGQSLKFNTNYFHSPFSLGKINISQPSPDMSNNVLDY